MSVNNQLMGRAELERVRDWAVAKITTGEEPPWAWYQYMKLREALDAILGGMDATQSTVDSQGSAIRRGGGLRLVGAVDPRETARSHSDVQAISLPM
jgi:hypothetical protein